MTTDGSGQMEIESNLTFSYPELLSKIELFDEGYGIDSCKLPATSFHSRLEIL